jgi:hypothetical protein
MIFVDCCQVHPKKQRKEKEDDEKKHPKAVSRQRAEKGRRGLPKEKEAESALCFVPGLATPRLARLRTFSQVWADSKARSVGPRLSSSRLLKAWLVMALRSV